MVPASFYDFFSGCASVAGALVGLLFVALSVSQERLSGPEASPEHQVRAAAAFSALVNALVIALVGLLPGANLGQVTTLTACTGLATTAALIVVLYREHQQKVGRPDIRMLAVLILLYGLQLANAVRLDGSPHNTGEITDQGALLIFFFIFGIARSWQLVGARNVSLASAVAAAIHQNAPGYQQARSPGPEDPGLEEDRG